MALSLSEIKYSQLEVRLRGRSCDPMLREQHAYGREEHSRNTVQLPTSIAGLVNIPPGCTFPGMGMSKEAAMTDSQIVPSYSLQDPQAACLWTYVR